MSLWLYIERAVTNEVLPPVESREAYLYIKGRVDSPSNTKPETRDIQAAFLNIDSTR